MSSTDHITTNQTGSISDPPDNRLRTREGKQRQGLSWWQASAAGAVAATVGNLVIFLIGVAADASFVVMDRGDLHEVTVGGVIVATVPPLVVGTVLAALLARWWPGVLRLAQVLGGTLALLTAAGPLMADTDGGTRLALALMHVVLGVAVVLSLEALRRRVKASREA